MTGDIRSRNVAWAASIALLALSACSATPSTGTWSPWGGGGGDAETPESGSPITQDSGTSTSNGDSSLPRDSGTDVGAATGDANGTQSDAGSGSDAGTVEGDGAGVDAGSPRNTLLQFIWSISGNKTVAGEHNRESSEGNFIQTMNDVTGHYPALWGGDFLFESNEIANRPNVVSYLMKGFGGGSIISLMYHACPPIEGESCSWDDIGGANPMHLTDAQWSDLVTDGGMLNGVWKSRLDAIAPYFQQLKSAGMAALFRPQHEMNQGVFWWGGRPGAGGTSALFQVTHDYLVNHWGLDNIVWVWSVQDIWDSSTNSYDFDQYNPGDSYWDVMSLDFYDGTGYTDQKYQAMLAEAGNKPIAIGECEVLPTPDELTAQPRWVYFMGWAELIQQDDSDAQITATYTAPSVLTQDKMPGW
jgi:mannan endo-1,4-beta-mannosidase